ncbi:MAG: hypothetical protein RR900_08930, partial [Ruthenibacterium sp.]
MKTIDMRNFFKKLGAQFLCVALLLGLFPVPTNTVYAAETVNANAAYMAPELTVTKGQENVDLLQGIVYDFSRYSISVTDM